MVLRDPIGNWMSYEKYNKRREREISQLSNKIAILEVA